MAKNNVTPSMRDKLKSYAEGRKPEPFEIPDFGTVFIRTITVAEARNLVTEVKLDNAGATRRILALAMVGEDGKPILDLNSAEDLEFFDVMPVVVYTELAQLALKKSGYLTPDMDEIEKN